MLPIWFIWIAISIRVIGGISYASAVLTGKARPNPITWFFWGLTPLITFVAQLYENVGAEAWVTFALAFGPLVIFILSLYKCWSRAHFTPATITCGILATIGVILWQLTDNPIHAIVFSILADIFGSIPTITKAYNDPDSEYAFPYFLSMLSMVLTLLTITHWTFASYAFPAYILAINFVIFWTIVTQTQFNQSSKRKKYRARRLTSVK